MILDGLCCTQAPQFALFGGRVQAAASLELVHWTAWVTRTRVTCTVLPVACRCSVWRALVILLLQAGQGEECVRSSRLV